jgi:hypothetical protein
METPLLITLVSLGLGGGFLSGLLGLGGMHLTDQMTESAKSGEGSHSKN